MLLLCCRALCWPGSLHGSRASSSWVRPCLPGSRKPRLCTLCMCVCFWAFTEYGGQLLYLTTNHGHAYLTALQCSGWHVCALLGMLAHADLPQQHTWSSVARIA